MYFKSVIKCSFVLFCVFVSLQLFAQDNESSLKSAPPRKENFWRRVSLGGNLGFQVGSVTGITVAPEAQVRAVDQLHVGVRFIYQYYNFKNYFVDTKTGELLSYHSNVFGGAIYLRYYLSGLFDSFLGNIFPHIEYEYMTYSMPYTMSGPPPVGYITDYYNWFVPGTQQIEINSLFIGGGYRQPIGSRVSMDLLILFNVNDSYYSPYSNPVFRLGVGVGL